MSALRVLNLFVRSVMNCGSYEGLNVLLGWEQPETTCDGAGKTAEQMTPCKSEMDVIKTDCEDGCGWAVSSGGVDTRVNSHTV